jgi:site-specific DNA recombinase
MTCPQIIDEELHQRALSVKSTHRTFKTWAPSKTPGLLQGLAYCGKCGGRIYITRSGHQNKVKYYMCNFVSPRRGKTCDTRYMKVELTDNIFWEALQDACRDEEKLLAYINRKKRPQDNAQPKQVRRHDLTSRLEKIQAERKVVMEWFSSSLLTQAEATDKLSTLKAEESQIRDDLASLDSPKSKPEKLSAADICDIINNCPDTPEARRQAVLNTIERVNLTRLDDNYGRQYIIDFDIFFK